jgi:HTH-type transcriptional regulator, sugar sensing transcriptional regulator
MSLSKLLHISGLSKYQSSLFITIIKNPEKTAKELSRLAKVPLGRIYTELEALEKQELIDFTEHRPKEYFIKYPQEKLLRLIENEKAKLEEIEKNSLKEFVNFDKKTAEIFSTSNEIKQSQIDCFRWAKEEVCQCLGSLHKPNSNRDLKAIYENEIFDAVNKGVIFKAIYKKGQTPPKSLLDLNLKNPENFQIKYSKIQLPRFDIIDSNQILLKIQDPTDTASTIGTIIINNITMAKKLRQKFLNLWDTSEN